MKRLMKKLGVAVMLVALGFGTGCTPQEQQQFGQFMQTVGQIDAIANGSSNRSHLLFRAGQAVQAQAAARAQAGQQ